jgi:hypothetical protein
LIATVDEFLARKLAESEQASGNPAVSLQSPMASDEISKFFAVVYEFQVVFLSEVAQANIYYASPKRAYDSTALIDYGETLLSQETIQGLRLSREKVVADVRAAARCLAFNLPTAMGFHIYRAIEAILVEEYFTLHVLIPPKHPNLGVTTRITIRRTR